MNNLLFYGYSASHSKEFIYGYPDNQDSYLLLLVTSPASFWVDGEFRDYPPNTAVLYAPGQRIFYKANGTEYENDWIRFTSDEVFVSGFPLKGIPFSVSDPEYCHNLFRLLTWEANLGSGHSDMIIADLLRVLFQKLLDDTVNTPDTPHAANLMRLRKQIANTPQLDWTVAGMSEQLHLSPGYLQLLYKQTFGTSCMEDVIEGRLRLAREQLTYTEKSILEIAEFCGYKNVEHFCRQFRKWNGCTPGVFRQTSKK